MRRSKVVIVRLSQYKNYIPAQETNWTAFIEDMDKIRREIRQSTGAADFKQLRKFELWGKAATLIGYALAWFPNPISIFLISLGNYTRWATIFHPISHGALDKVPGVPAKYTKKVFASGFRRFTDWFDWITPDSWDIEHNRLHHYHLGTENDPDVVYRNTAFIRSLKVPMFVKYAIAFVVACVWKPFYYAPNTIAEARFHRGLSTSNALTAKSWSLFSPEGRELWFKSLLPYTVFRFIALPALFLPISTAAAIAVLINSVCAEVLTNLHSFATIAPNHTGDDIEIFNTPAKGRAEYYYRQIAGTVNFPAGGDVMDFLYGGMNYQVEHHIWPDASFLQYRRVRPQLVEICQKHGIKYNEGKLFPRILMTFKVMAGAAKPLEIPNSSKANAC